MMTSDDILTLQPVSPMAVAWLAELHSLKASMSGDPSHSAAWRWRMRVRILTFLLSRYGSDPNLGVRREGTTDFPLSTFVVQERNTKLVRSGTVIRKALYRVSEANKYKLA